MVSEQFLQFVRVAEVVDTVFRDTVPAQDRLLEDFRLVLLAVHIN